MEAKVVSFQAYKRNKKRGALTPVQYGILLLSIVCMCCSLLSLVFVFMKAEHYVWMAILMLSGIAWLLVSQGKKVYGILRHKPIHNHYEYLSFYPLLTSVISGFTMMALFVYQQWIGCIFSLMICGATVYLYIKMSKLI